MYLFKTIAGLRTELAKNRQNHTIGLVPTMGALHLGHQSLIRRARWENDLVLVSIFVNPLQFAPTEDLDKYPRSLEADCQLCEKLGVDGVFAPTPEVMGIPEGDNSQASDITAVIPPTSMTSVLCAPFRPHHFQGVATVVTKLFNIIQPKVAYFGEKDGQQLAIIRRLVQDLQIPVEIRACPTVREASGLAVSSRNQYLTPQEKEKAAILYRSLQQAQQAWQNGERDASKLRQIVRQKLAQIPEIKLQYVELVHPQTLMPLTRVEELGMLAIACYLGSTRLIDNLILQQRQPIIAIDGPAGAGKSTVTRRVAKALGLLYLDTGAMYRAVTWLVMDAGIALEEEGAIAELISQATIELIPCGTSQKALMGVKINGKDISEAIRTPEVTAQVSKIAAQPAVRQALVKLQQHYGQQGGLIMEGRDIGTNVFPDADLKIFLTASVSERARRRWQDLKSQGRGDIALEKLAAEIEQRDYQDSHRSIAPLQKAVDAMEINTDGLTIEAVSEKILSFYQQKFPS